MKALSILQPWASLIAAGAKKWETRSYRTLVRGTIAIHASKAFTRQYRELCFQPPFWPALIRVAGEQPQNLPLGAIVAVADLTDCLSVPDSTLAKLSDEEKAFGDYSYGRYAWKLENVQRLPEPIPCKGALSFWTVSKEIEDRIYTK